MTQFAIMRGYIVTANDDGTIPLNSKVVGVLDNGIHQQQLDQMLTQANSQPDLLAALKQMRTAFPVMYSHPLGAPNSPARKRWEQEVEADKVARAAIARAEGRTDE